MWWEHVQTKDRLSFSIQQHSAPFSSFFSTTVTLRSTKRQTTQTVFASSNLGGGGEEKMWVRFNFFPFLKMLFCFYNTIFHDSKTELIIRVEMLSNHLRQRCHPHKVTLSPATGVGISKLLFFLFSYVHHSAPLSALLIALYWHTRDGWDLHTRAEVLCNRSLQEVHLSISSRSGAEARGNHTQVSRCNLFGGAAHNLHTPPFSSKKFHSGQKGMF